MVPDDPNGAATRRFPTRVAANFALTLCSVLVSLIMAELVLRLMGVHFDQLFWTDAYRGVAHVPGAKSAQQYAGHPFIEINRDGLRGPDIPLEHPTGTLRIALLGDSFIEGFQVPFEKTVGEVIARELSARRGQPVQVLNFGVGGYGTTQELLTLRHEAWKYAPDLIVLGVTTGNDISDNSRALKHYDYVPYYVFQGDTLVLDTSFRASAAYRARSAWKQPILEAVLERSSLVQLVNRVRYTRRREERQEEHATAPSATDADSGPGAGGAKGTAPGEELGLRDEVLLPPTTQEWKEAWRVTEAVLTLMRDECRRKHTLFALVTLTRAIQVTPRAARKERFLGRLGATDLYYPERRLAEFGRREGIRVLNLAPTMAELALQRHVYFHAERGQLDVGHWNEEGHRVAGEVIAGWLATLLADSTATWGAAADKEATPGEPLRR